MQRASSYLQARLSCHIGGSGGRNTDQPSNAACHVLNGISSTPAYIATEAAGGHDKWRCAHECTAESRCRSFAPQLCLQLPRFSNLSTEHQQTNPLFRLLECQLNSRDVVMLCDALSAFTQPFLSTDARSKSARTGTGSTARTGCPSCIPVSISGTATSSPNCGGQASLVLRRQPGLDTKA